MPSLPRDPLPELVDGGGAADEDAEAGLGAGQADLLERQLHLLGGLEWEKRQRVHQTYQSNVSVCLVCRL
jgi:hypothetical protein